MNPTSTSFVVEVAPHMAPTRRILRNAQHRIDQIWAGALGRHVPDLAHEACWDVILQAGRDLDRVAAHRRMTVVLVPKPGGGQ